MISGRTRALLIGSTLPILACAGILLWLVLVPYYDRLIGKRSSFVVLHFHFTPWLWLWIVVVVIALISILLDRVATRKR